MPRKPVAEYDIKAKDGSAAGWRDALRTADSAGRKLRATIGSAFGGAISVQLFTSQIAKAIEFGDEIGKLKVKFGETAEATQELVAVARQFDIEVGGLATSLRKMQVGVSQAATGNKELLETFAALGLNVETIRRMRPADQFEAFADAISRLKDPADRARAATALFGRSGADLLPMFEQGAEGIRKAREEVQQFGHVLSELEIKKLQEADDAIKKLDQTWDTFWRKVAVGVVSYGEMIGGAADKLGEFATQDSKLASLARRGLSGLPFIGPLALTAEEQASAEAANDYTRGGGSRRGRARPGPAPAPGYGGGTSDAFTESDFNALMEGADLRRNIEMWENWRKVVDDTDRGIRDGVLETNKDLADSFGDLQEPILKTSDAMTVFGEEAARNTQDWAADFIYNLGEMEDGLRGWLKSFVDVLRRMSSEIAASQIFDKLGGTQGVANWFTSLFTGFGSATSASPATAGAAQQRAFNSYAVGTNYVPNDQLALVHKGEAIIPAKYNRGGMGRSLHYAPVFKIDARGATKDAVPAMMAAVKELIAQDKVDTLQGLQSGRYPLGK